MVPPPHIYVQFLVPYMEHFYITIILALQVLELKDTIDLTDVVKMYYDCKFYKAYQHINSAPRR